MRPQLFIVRDSNEGSKATIFGYKYALYATVKDKTTGRVFYEYVLASAIAKGGA